MIYQQKKKCQKFCFDIFATFVIPFFVQDNSISFHGLYYRVSLSIWLEIFSFEFEL